MRYHENTRWPDDINLMTLDLLSYKFVTIALDDYDFLDAIRLSDKSKGEQIILYQDDDQIRSVQAKLSELMKGDWADRVFKSYAVEYCDGILAFIEINEGFSLFAFHDSASDIIESVAPNLMDAGIQHARFADYISRCRGDYRSYAELLSEKIVRL